MLETARLRLRPWDLARDLGDFIAICHDVDVMRYIGDGHLWSEDESRSWIETNLATMAKYGFCQWAVEARDGGELLGFCGFRSWDNPKEGVQGDLLVQLRPAMGWRLSRASWGHGYATEAAAAALTDGFGRCGFERVIATVQPANKPSAGVAGKLGMQEQVDVSDTGLLVFAIVKQQWGAMLCQL